MTSSPRSSPAGALLAGLAAFGPHFAIETHRPRTGTPEPWQPLAALLSSPDALRRRAGHVRAALAAAAHRHPESIEFRVSASVAQLGIAARLICPALGAAALGTALPIDAGQARWVPSPSGLFRLSLPRPALAVADADEPCPGLLDGPISSLVEATAAMSVSRRVLWGNVASAINGAASMIAAVRPGLTAQANAASSALLRSPALAGNCRTRPATGFQRRSCCLIYRIASPPATGYCGDCLLNG